MERTRDTAVLPRPSAAADSTGPAGNAVAAALVPPLTVLDDRPVVALGLEVCLAGVAEATGVVVVGRVPRPLEAVRAAAARGLTVVVVLDQGERPSTAAAALDAGARGVVLISGGRSELVRVVREARGGRVAVAAAVAERLDRWRGLRARFTARELEVLALYATGMPAKSVARRMDVGLETVKTYIKRLREKAKAVGMPTETRMELAALARALDLQ